MTNSSSATLQGQVWVELSALPKETCTAVELFFPACLFELELCSILVMVTLGRSEYVSVINSSDERGLVDFPYKITGGG